MESTIIQLAKMLANEHERADAAESAEHAETVRSAKFRDTIRTIGRALEVSNDCDFDEYQRRVVKAVLDRKPVSDAEAFINDIKLSIATRARERSQGELDAIYVMLKKANLPTKNCACEAIENLIGLYHEATAHEHPRPEARSSATECACVEQERAPSDPSMGPEMGITLF
jgi:hypothetical protein